MDDCLTLAPERSVNRAFYAAGQEEQGLLNSQAQSKVPDWDPYSFHQQGNRTSTDVPKPLPVDTRTQPRPEVPLPPLPDRPQEIRLPDGSLNVKDSFGRVILTASQDGRKSRAVQFSDPSDPYKVTQAVIDQNRVFTRNPDGRSWTVMVNGRPGGTWHGDIRMSANGEYSFEDYRNGEKRHFAPNTAEIVDASTVHVRRPECNTNDCNTNYNPRTQYRYPTQNEWSRYYDPRQGGCRTQDCQPYYPQQTREYYDPRQQYYPQQNRDYYPRQQCYPQDRRSGYYDGCSSGYYRNGNIGAQIGRAALAGVLGYGMPYGGGYYPRYGGYGGGGNIAGAVLGTVINRAIWGGGRGCRW